MADQAAEGEIAVSNNAQNSGEVAPQAGNEAQEAQAPPAERQSFLSIAKAMIVRCLIIYFITSFFRRPAANPNQTATPNSVMPATNLFDKNSVMDLYVYVDEAEVFTDFKNKKKLFWLEEELSYGDWTAGPNGDGSFEKSGKLHISEQVMNNGSLYIHVYITKGGRSPDPDDENYTKRFTFSKFKMLSKYKKRKYHTLTNLLTGNTEAHPDLIRRANETTVEVLAHWHPNLTINLLDDHTPWSPGAIPAPLSDYIDFVPGMNNYYPVIFYNDYWNLNTEFMPINQTTPVLNLTLTYSPISLFRWQMYAAQGMRSKWYSFLGDDMVEESDEEQDSLKRTFLETSPYLLGLTIVVSLVHSVFEFLAFKNDIQFWRSRKSLEGLSVRSIFFNVFQSLIVLLYVFDNDTNTVIRISIFVGLIIELWKIHKVVDVKYDRDDLILGILPRIKLTDKQSYTQSNTKEYDQTAFKYLSWMLFPLMACYAVYSLIYNEHKGYYSFVLNMMYGFLLTFGFIMMTPQLFINYKLKSVAHLPWRMLTYKALNTFIDDIFAFVIKMPTLYRIGCLRDDVIFFIYLYQRYIYRVDPKRVNEFGTSQEMLEQNGEAAIEGANGDATPALEGSTEPKPNEEKKND